MFVIPSLFVIPEIASAIIRDPGFDRSVLRDGPDAATSEAAGLGPEPAATAGRRELGRAGRPVPRGTVPKGVRGASPVPRGAEPGVPGGLEVLRVEEDKSGSRVFARDDKGLLLGPHLR